jgi:hypothetical protein
LFAPTPASRSLCHSPFLLLTPWARAIIENLIVAQLVKKFSAFYGNRKLTNISMRDATGACTEPYESTPRPPILPSELLRKSISIPSRLFTVNYHSIVGRGFSTRWTSRLCWKLHCRLVRGEGKLRISLKG